MKIETETRFWNKVQKTDNCWLWTAGKDGRGYGSFNVNRKAVRTHRLAWELTNGPIPVGLCVCHRCDIRACVNPVHLFLGTYADNRHDCEQKGRGNHTAIGLKIRGEGHGRSKLNRDQVREIRRRYADGGIHLRDLAKEFDVDHGSIRKIITRQNWAWLN